MRLKRLLSSRRQLRIGSSVTLPRSLIPSPFPDDGHPLVGARYLLASKTLRVSPLDSAPSACRTRQHPASDQTWQNGRIIWACDEREGAKGLAGRRRTALVRLSFRWWRTPENHWPARGTWSRYAVAPGL